MPQERKTPPKKDDYSNGQSDVAWNEGENRVRDSAPFAFGQFQNIIYIGIFPLNQPAHGGIES